MTQIFFFTPVGVFAKLFLMPEWKSGHCKNEFTAFSLEDVMLLLLFYVNVVDGHCPKNGFGQVLLGMKILSKGTTKKCNRSVTCHNFKSFAGLIVHV